MGACPRSSEWCPQSIGNTVRFQSEQLSAFIGIRNLEAAVEAGDLNPALKLLQDLEAEFVRANADKSAAA